MNGYGGGVESLKEYDVLGVPVVEYQKSLHFSKNYFNTLNRFKDISRTTLPLKEALEYLLTSKKIPPAERDGITGFTVYNENKIICLHCYWAPTLFRMRDQIFQEIGWYPYVTGRILEESQISQDSDAWLGSRNFNALEFPEFSVEKITLEDVCSGNGIALILKINEFKILLDCCFNIEMPMDCTLQEPPDLLYLSHAHKDHIATFGTFISQFGDIPLILSHTTLDLIRYFNQNSRDLQKYLRQNAYPLIFNDVYRINSSISLQVIKAGHYPGASMLYLYIPEHRLLYTGDICLYDIQPLKGSSSGIQNLNGPLHSLIIEGRFCNEYFPSQKIMLDKACEKAVQTLHNGAPVLVLGDPGSWLLIFYLKFFYYLSQLNERYRIYIDAHTLEIMKILRYRKEDITPYLQQEILRFHDPFASITRQDLASFDLNIHSLDDPPIILFNSNQYEDPPPDYFSHIFNNPNALLIITGPLRSNALRTLWTTGNYDEIAPKPISCEMFGRFGNSKHPKFSLHADKGQLLEILRHLIPPHVYLFHRASTYLEDFQKYFTNRLRKRYPNTEIHALAPNAYFTLYDSTMLNESPLDPEMLFSRFLPLIKTLQFAKEEGLSEVGLSRIGQLLTSKFPYWKEQAEVTKVAEYIFEAASANIVEVDRSKPEIFVKLKNI